MDAGSVSNEAGWFWTRLDPGIAATLTGDQRDAIAAAVSRDGAASRPVDIRFTLFGHFVVLMFGKERRSKQRLRSERAKKPVLTLKNLPMLVFLWGALTYTTFGILGVVNGLVFGN